MRTCLTKDFSKKQYKLLAAIVAIEAATPIIQEYSHYYCNETSYLINTQIEGALDSFNVVLSDLEDTLNGA